MRVGVRVGCGGGRVRSVENGRACPVESRTGVER